VKGQVQWLTAVFSSTQRQRSDGLRLEKNQGKVSKTPSQSILGSELKHLIVTTKNKSKESTIN
jgi:hypothetical protein